MPGREFRPATGQARMLIVPLTNVAPADLVPVAPKAPRDNGIELF